jgi:hypothetical protein
MGMMDDEMDAMRGGFPHRPLVRFEAIGEGWGLLMQRWPLWLLTVLIVLIGYSVVGGMIYSLFRVKPIGGPGAFWIGLSPKRQAMPIILSTVVISPFLGGMFRMACRQIRGQHVGIETLFSVVDVLPQLILGSILYGLATFLGFFVLVVPGFIAAGVLMFTIPLIVDGGLPATDAMGQSWHALKHQWLSATLFHIVAGFVAWIGFCFCVVGFIVTAPLYCLSIAVLYRDFFMVKSA